MKFWISLFLIGCLEYSIEGRLLTLKPNSSSCVRGKIQANQLVIVEYEVTDSPGQTVDYIIHDSIRNILSQKENIIKGNFSFTSEFDNLYELCFSSKVPPSQEGLDQKISVDIINEFSFELGNFQNKTYIYYADKQPWNGAQIICNINGYELVRIDNKAEENVFFSLVQNDERVNTEGILVGGMKLGDSWIWRSDYTPIYAGMKWHRPDPNNFNNDEYCMAIAKGFEDIGYIDTGCVNQPLHFICQNYKNVSTDIREKVDNTYI